MATKTITITEDVYIAMKEIKKEGESFSDLLRHLINKINGYKLAQF